MGTPRAHRGRRCLPRQPRGEAARPRARGPRRPAPTLSLSGTDSDGRRPAGGLLLRRLPGPAPQAANTPAGPPADSPLPVLPVLPEREPEEGGGGRDSGTSCQWQGKGGVLSFTLCGPGPQSARKRRSGCRKCTGRRLGSIKRNVQSTTHERGPWQIKRFQLLVHAGMHATGRGQQSSARVGRRTNHNPRPLADTQIESPGSKTPAIQCSSAVERQRAGCGRS